MLPAPFYLTAVVPALLPAFCVLRSALHSLTQRLLQVTGQMPDTPPRSWKLSLPVLSPGPDFPQRHFLCLPLSLLVSGQPCRP